jgi:hypothetical protein
MAGRPRIKMLLRKQQDVTKLGIYQNIFTGMTPEKRKLGTWKLFSFVNPGILIDLL